MQNPTYPKRCEKPPTGVVVTNIFKKRRRFCKRFIGPIYRPGIAPWSTLYFHLGSFSFSRYRSDVLGKAFRCSPPGVAVIRCGVAFMTPQGLSLVERYVQSVTELHRARYQEALAASVCPSPASRNHLCASVGRQRLRNPKFALCRSQWTNRGEPLTSSHAWRNCGRHHRVCLRARPDQDNGLLSIHFPFPLYR
jgi:hypothetical protein